MSCDEVTDRLPWLLNGSLEGDEREAVRAHLAACDRCGRELEETRQAMAVFGAHLPSAALVDLAWDRPVVGVPAPLAQRHLESCPQCADELALVRESRRLEGAVEAPRGGGRRSFTRFAEWGGSLAAGLLIGLWWGGALHQRTPPPPAASPPAPRAGHDEELARLRASVGDLEAQLEGARAPQPDLPIFELMPADQVVRSGEGIRELVVPSSARLVALLLIAETGSRPASLEIRTAGGKQVWSGSGLRPGPLGAYSIGVPAALLPEGRYELVLKPAGERASRYLMRVRHAR